MQKIILFFVTVFAANFLTAQNIGIGTNTPNRSKLQIVGSGNQLLTSSGTDQPGITHSMPLSLSPNLSFNLYYANAFRFMGPGYGSKIQYTPSSGLMDFSSSTTKGNPGDVAFFNGSSIAIDSNGYIGAGTTEPKVKLHLEGSGSPELFRIEGTTGVQMGLSIAGVQKGFFNLTGDDVKIGTLASNDLGSFIVRVNGADRMFVQPDGRVSIGTPVAANGYILSLNGKAICTELKVQLKAGWPDYVFHKNYDLKSFDELRSFIAENNHLPNIPAAAELEKSGLEVGEMQRKMMEKIEELTLYVLQLEKEVRSLKDNKQ